MVDFVLPKVEVPDGLRKVELSGAPNRLPQEDIVADSLYSSGHGIECWYRVAHVRFQRRPAAIRDKVS